MHPGRITHTRLSIIRALAMLAILGCGNDIAPTRPLPPTVASAAFWSMSLSHHAVTLATAAPYDTLRLVATPLDAHGAPLPVTGVLTFTSPDLHTVQVDSTGLLHAIAPGSNVQVVATLAEGNLIHTDTALINVTSDDAPAPIATFVIRPTGPDTVLLALGIPLLGGQASLAVQAVDVLGNAMTDIAIEVTSSDTSMVKVCGVSGTEISLCASSSNGTGRPGRTRIIASTTTYGVTLADTVPVMVTPPNLAFVFPTVQAQSVGGPLVPTFVPGSTTMAPGGTVLWFNSPLLGGSGQPTDIAFDDSVAVAEPQDAVISFFSYCVGGTGNIPAFGDTTSTMITANMCRGRSFPVPGIYRYHSVLTGATGQIVVTDGSSGS